MLFFNSPFYFVIFNENDLARVGDFDLGSGDELLDLSGDDDFFTGTF